MKRRVLMALSAGQRDNATNVLMTNIAAANLRIDQAILNGSTVADQAQNERTVRKLRNMLEAMVSVDN